MTQIIQDVDCDSTSLQQTATGATENVVGQATCFTQPYRTMRKKFIAIVVAQIFAIAALAAPKAYTLTTGTVVSFKAEPIDPSDIFRGEYATLRYKNISEVPGSSNFQCDDKVFVLLTKKNKDWCATSVSRERPQLHTNSQVIITGKVNSTGGAEEPGKPTLVYVDYGIERFYTPEHRSADLEHRGAKVTVDVAIDQMGNSCICKVYDGKTEIYDGLDMLNPFK